MLDNNKLAINFQHLHVDIYRNLHILQMPANIQKFKKNSNAEPLNDPKTDRHIKLRQTLDAIMYNPPSLLEYLPFTTPTPIYRIHAALKMYNKTPTSTYNECCILLHIITPFDYPHVQLNKQKVRPRCNACVDLEERSGGGGGPRPPPWNSKA